MEIDTDRTVTRSSPARLMTTGQVAERYGVNPSTVRRYADAGLLPCQRLPRGARRFRPEDVDELLRTMSVAVDA